MAHLRHQERKPPGSFRFQDAPQAKTGAVRTEFLPTSRRAASVCQVRGATHGTATVMGPKAEFSRLPNAREAERRAAADPRAQSSGIAYRLHQNASPKASSRPPSAHGTVRVARNRGGKGARKPLSARDAPALCRQPYPIVTRGTSCACIPKQKKKPSVVPSCAQAHKHTPREEKPAGCCLKLLLARHYCTQHVRLRRLRARGATLPRKPQQSSAHKGVRLAAAPIQVQVSQVDQPRRRVVM